MKNLTKKIIPYALMAGLALIPLTGCEESRIVFKREFKRELSDIIYEQAVVTSKKHSPEEDYTYLGIAVGNSINDLPTGLGLAAAMHQDEKNYITFTGQKVTFDINNKEIFNRFELNDPAEISYKEIYSATYEDLDNDGEKDLVEKTLEGYKFLDAKPKK